MSEVHEARVVDGEKKVDELKAYVPKPEHVEAHAKALAQATKQLAIDTAARDYQNEMEPLRVQLRAKLAALPVHTNETHEPILQAHNSLKRPIWEAYQKLRTEIDSQYP